MRSMRALAAGFLAANGAFASPVPDAPPTLPVSLPSALLDIELSDQDLDRLTHVARRFDEGVRLSARQDGDGYKEVLADKEKFCGWNRDTMQGAQDALVNTGALTYLRVFIELDIDMKNGEKFGLASDPTKWLEKWEKAVFLDDDSGTTGGDGCWDVGHDCKPGGFLYDKPCSEYFDAGTYIQDKYSDQNADVAELLANMLKTSYWIFEAVKGSHEKIGALLSKLFRQALISDLQIDAMVEEIAPADESSAAADILGSLATAVGLVGTFAGFGSGPTSEAVSSGTDIMGTILDTVAGEFEDEPEEFDTGSIRAALGDFVERTETLLERALMLSVGTRRSSELKDMMPELEFWQLPTFDRPDLILKPPLGYFYNGYWLMGTSNDDYQASLTTFRDNMRATVVHNIVKADGNFLYGHPGIKEDECNEMPHAVWHHDAKRDYDYCFHLAKNDDYNYYEDVDESVYAALQEYGITDINTYYQAILECGNYLNTDRGEKKPKFSIGMGAELGKIPYCHFNLPVAIGSRITCPNPGLSIDCIEPHDIDCDSNGKNCDG